MGNECYFPVKDYPHPYTEAKKQKYIPVIDHKVQEQCSFILLIGNAFSNVGCASGKRKFVVNKIDDIKGNGDASGNKIKVEKNSLEAFMGVDYQG